MTADFPEIKWRIRYEGLESSQPPKQKVFSDVIKQRYASLTDQGDGQSAEARHQWH